MIQQFQKVHIKITGTAWIDSNKNGMRDSEEELLSNVKSNTSK